MEQVQATSKTRKPELCESHPLYTIAWSDYVYGSEMLPLPDGTFVLAVDVCGNIGLYKDVVAMDAGNNVVRHRTAFGGSAGIAKPTANGSLTVVGQTQVGWLELAR